MPQQSTLEFWLDEEPDSQSWSKSPACSVRMEARIFVKHCSRFSTSGRLTSGGECWTLSGSEFPKDAEGCSLSAIFEANVPEKYSLSQRACEGILRRAEKRGKSLPPTLRQALTQVAGGTGTT